MNCQYFLKVSTLIFALVVLTACAEKQGEGASLSNGVREAKPVVYVSNYPLQYFVERIAPWTEVRFPCNISGDPAYWKPTAEDVSAMQQADLIILNGASYESWLRNVTLPPSKLVNTAEGFSDRLIPLADKTTHSHGLGGEHEDSGTAFTTWLDMKLAVEQAQAIADAFSARWPEYEMKLRQSCTALEKDLLALDEQIENTVRAAQNRPVVFSHPVYQYFQKRYGIHGKSVHWEPDEMPDEAMWQELTNLISGYPAKWMIWEGEPLPEIAARLKSMGIQSVVFDPCAGMPSQEDFLSIMTTNIEALKIVYRDS